MVKFREFELGSGRKIFLGRDSASNDELVFVAGSKDVLLHTEMPGSPFVNLGESPSKEEISEGSVFCAKFSQAWRDSKKDVVVNVFRRCDMKKDKKAKEGSWVVDSKDRVVVKRLDILRLEKELSVKN